MHLSERKFYHQSRLTSACRARLYSVEPWSLCRNPPADPNPSLSVSFCSHRPILGEFFNFWRQSPHHCFQIKYSLGEMSQFGISTCTMIDILKGFTWGKGDVVFESSHILSAFLLSHPSYLFCLCALLNSFCCIWKRWKIDERSCPRHISPFSPSITVMATRLHERLATGNSKKSSTSKQFDLCSFNFLTRF